MKGHLRRWTIKQSFDSFERKENIKAFGPLMISCYYFLQEVIKLRVDFRPFLEIYV